MGGYARLAIAACLVLVPRGASAQTAGAPAVPPPSWARSIEVVNDGAPVMMAPDGDARRRGTVGVGTRLGFSKRVFGPGCGNGVWYETSDALFICEDHVQPSAEPPGPAIDQWAVEGARLPQRYAFIRFGATRAYLHPSDYFRNDYEEALGKGFGIVVTGEQVYDGVPFVRTRRHLWIEKGSVRFVEGSSFAGEKLAPGEELDVAWAARGPAKVYARPQGPVKKRLGRHTAVHVARTKGAWAELVGGGWMRRSDLALANQTEPPEGVGPSDRWIDVDVAQQVLVAYEGKAPMFATLVSTGRNTKQSETPLGTFRIWVKLDYTDMDDLERTDLDKNYSIQDVPWVQFFKDAYGFHAAFWHDDFGRRRSHGCINLSPSDARYLFQFTQPALPPGWNAILPIPEDRPTVVRIR